MNDKKHSTVGPFGSDPIWSKYTENVVEEAVEGPPIADGFTTTNQWGEVHFNGTGPWALDIILNPTDEGGGHRIRKYVGFDEEPPVYFNAKEWIDREYLKDEFPINRADRKHVWRLDPESQHLLRNLERSGEDRNTIDNSIDNKVEDYTPTKVELVRVYNKQEEADRALDSGMHPGNERFGRLD